MIGLRVLPGAPGRRAFRWGFVDQALSSAISLLMTFVAARLLGAAGLGTLFVGFVFVFAALGLYRAAVTEPLLVKTAGAAPAEKRTADRAALTLVGLLSAPITISALLAWVVWPSNASRGSALMAVWAAPVLVQDLTRSLLFRDGRERTATSSEALWVASFAAATLILAVPVDRDWALAASWGIGAVAAAGVNLVRTGLVPSSPMSSIRWWRREALRLARWLVAGSAVYSVMSYGSIAVLTGIVGASALGGLRAAQSLLTPLSFLAPALTMPGLPLIAARWRHSRTDGWATGRSLAAFATAATLAFVLTAIILRVPLMGLFGNDFAEYDYMVTPLALGSLAGAPAIGFILLLKASGAGKAFFYAGAVSAVSTALIPLALASTVGVTAMAWGFFAAGALSSTAALSAAYVVTFRLPLTERSGKPVQPVSERFHTATPLAPTHADTHTCGGPDLGQR